MIMLNSYPLSVIITLWSVNPSPSLPVSRQYHRADAVCLAQFLIALVTEIEEIRLKTCLPREAETVMNLLHLFSLPNHAGGPNHL